MVLRSLALFCCLVVNRLQVPHAPEPACLLCARAPQISLLPGAKVMMAATEGGCLRTYKFPLTGEEERRLLTRAHCWTLAHLGSSQFSAQCTLWPWLPVSSTQHNTCSNHIPRRVHRDQGACGAHLAAALHLG